MAIQIVRHSRDTINVAITNDSTTTQEIDFRDFAGGTIYVPTGSSLTSLTFYAASSLGQTYNPLNAPVDQTVNPIVYVPVVMTVSGGNNYPIPDAAYGAYCLRITGDQATATIALTSKG